MFFLDEPGLLTPERPAVNASDDVPESHRRCKQTGGRHHSGTEGWDEHSRGSWTTRRQGFRPDIRTGKAVGENESLRSEEDSRWPSASFQTDVVFFFFLRW